jgi:uncharacterized protein YycO
LIRWFTWSKWNHVAVKFETGIVEARYSGVCWTTLKYLKKQYSVVEEVQIEVPDLEGAFRFATKQVGKPYDWTAVFGHPFRRNWNNPEKWFCSELAEAIIEAGGKKRFRTDLYRITPAHQYMVSV